MMLAGAVVLAAFALECYRAVRRPIEVEVPATMPREPVVVLECRIRTREVVPGVSDRLITLGLRVEAEVLRAVASQQVGVVDELRVRVEFSGDVRPRQPPSEGTRPSRST